jgi:hypothetical protein
MSNFFDLDSLFRDRTTYPNPCNYELTPNQIASWFFSSRAVRALPQNAGTQPLEFVCTINLQVLTLPYPRVDLFATTCYDVDEILLNTLMSPGHTFVNNDVIQATFSTNGVLLGVQYYVINANPGVSFQISRTMGGPAEVLVDGTGLGLIMCLVITSTGDDTVAAALEDAMTLLTFPRLYVDFHCKRYPDIHLISTINGVQPDARFIVVLDRTQHGVHGEPLWLHYRTNMEQTIRFQRNDPIVFSIRERSGTVISFFDDVDLEQLADPQKQCLVTFTVTPYIRDADYSNHAVAPLPAK